MKKIVLLFVLLPILSIAQQNRSYFNYLKDFGYGVYAQPSCRSARGVSINADEIIPVIFTKLSSSSQEYLVCFNDGPNDETGFVFYSKSSSGYVEKFYLDGDRIFIPGNGFVYTSGHLNEIYGDHRKYKFTGTELMEVKQPYYYVGLKTKTKKAIKLYSDYNCTKVLAYLPANSNIEVVASKKSGNNQKFLIKTPFGLLGWWKLDTYYSEEIQDVLPPSGY